MSQLELVFAPPSTAARDREGPLVRTARLHSGTIAYRLVRQRRRTIAIMVLKDGVEVRAPRSATLGEIEGFLGEKSGWIAGMLEQARQAPPPFAWRSGAMLPFLGRKLRLVAHPLGDEVRLSESRLEVGLASVATYPALRERTLAWVKQQALAHFSGRIEALRPLAELQAPQLGLSNAGTLWGTCNWQGRILLNWKLVLMPPHLVDYVVAHELSHLREMNHSKRFWAVVGRMYPEYKAARRELHMQARRLPEL